MSKERKEQVPRELPRFDYIKCKFKDSELRVNNKQEHQNLYECMAEALLLFYRCKFGKLQYTKIALTMLM